MRYKHNKDKPSIAIVTLYGDYNFGNKLQNYATQQYFSALGFDVATIPYIEEEYDRPIPINMIISYAKRLIICVLRRLKLIKKTKRSELYWIRQKRFKAFSEKYLVLDKKVSYRALPVNLKDRFDYFVTGSDQVWHCTHNDPKELKFFLLMFADPSQRVTMSPSFGFDILPQKYESIYRMGISGFNKISCREASGVQIIKNYSKVTPELLLDPCMLVDESSWINLMKKPTEHIIDRDYILLYSLGGIPDSLQKQIVNLSNLYNLELVDLYNESNSLFLTTGPEEFLYYIRNATLIITDSFHAVLFSILFKKDFYVFNRTDNKTMGNRIGTILERFSLESAIVSSDSDISLERGSAYRYAKVDSVLREERLKAMDFYEQTFSGNVNIENTIGIIRKTI